MIAKIIAYGQNRKEALSRLQRALRESVVVIRGGASNKAFLLELLNRAEVQRGEVDVGWLDRLAATGEHVSRRYADVALVQAAIEAYDAAVGGGADAVLCVGGARAAAGPQRGRPDSGAALSGAILLAQGLSPRPAAVPRGGGWSAHRCPHRPSGSV